MHVRSLKVHNVPGGVYTDLADAGYIDRDFYHVSKAITNHSRKP